MSSTVYYSIGYDIPERSGIPNPSGFFRRLGFRRTLSDWVIPADKMPWHYLNEFKARLEAFKPRIGSRDATGKCRWLKAESDTAEMREFARHCVREEIGRLVALAARNLSQARAAYEEPREGREISPGEFEERVQRNLQTRIEELEATLEGAAMFDVSPQDTPADWARAEIEKIEHQSKEQARRYVAATRALQDTPTADAQAVAPAAQADAAPPEVMADVLRDAGNDAEADALMAAFARPAADGYETDEWDRLTWE
jgi:hypothetical protein